MSAFFLHCSKIKRSRRADFVRILLVLTFPFAATFPKAICCYFVTWSLTSLAQMIVLHQPAVKKLLFNKANNPTGPSSEAPTGPTAEDSPCPVDENEQTLHQERREASDSSVDQDRDQSDTKPEKDK